MTVFKENNEDTDRLDYRILRDSVVSLYWRNKFLKSDLEWFEKEHYEIIVFDCRSWTNENEMHKQLKENLFFPEYYGMNFNALRDCLWDLVIRKGGLVIVFEHLDYLKSDLIHAILDVFVQCSRQKMLFGYRLIVLAQVDNPYIEIAPLGAYNAMWNGEEWFNSSREE